jgi:hypothetical protein
MRAGIGSRASRPQVLKQRKCGWERIPNEGIGHSFGEAYRLSQIGETRERPPRAPYAAPDNHGSYMVIRTAQTLKTRRTVEGARDAYRA